MTVAQRPSHYLDRPSSSGLVDVIDLILDKGLVIDIYIRVSLVGIELLTIDARIVVASVDTYLRFAEAVNRLDLREDKTKGLPELVDDMRQGGARSKTRGALEGVKESVGEVIDRVKGDKEEEPERQERPRSRSRPPHKERES
ncbi:gas vesicle protein GvpJ [Kitasatospora sp. NPDC097605]|uniref:gas vesicle protein GvpJ n=1 Tax=Kitasatospora sp. NPDC097605 TaxID=3157226 RepID=UPI003318C133